MFFRLVEIIEACDRKNKKARKYLINKAVIKFFPRLARRSNYLWRRFRLSVNRYGSRFKKTVSSILGASGTDTERFND